MRHGKKFRKLNRVASHRKLMLAGQVKALILHGKVDTTVTRAKESRILAEKLITWAKQGDLHARRQAFRILQDEDLVKKLFAELAARYQDRSGGYTRVLKLPPRRGDGAEMARLLLV
jgi:large subunit ribosomal protein L17